MVTWKRVPCQFFCQQSNQSARSFRAATGSFVVFRHFQGAGGVDKAPTAINAADSGLLLRRVAAFHHAHQHQQRAVDRRGNAQLRAALDDVAIQVLDFRRLAAGNILRR